MQISSTNSNSFNYSRYKKKGNIQTVNVSLLYKHKFYHQKTSTLTSLFLQFRSQTNSNFSFQQNEFFLNKFAFLKTFE
jgi:hypothetical protein